MFELYILVVVLSALVRASELCQKGLQIMGYDIQKPTQFWYDHPVAMSFAVLGRWAFLLSKMLCTDLFGRTVLPACSAASSGASASFACYVLLATLAVSN